MQLIFQFVSFEWAFQVNKMILCVWFSSFQMASQFVWAEKFSRISRGIASHTHFQIAIAAVTR